jgi:hypothetical protein
LAWYDSAPNNSKVSRKQQLNEPELKLPECENEFLVFLFYEVGIHDIGANGIVPLTWQTIESWLNVMERDLTIFEKKTIKDMSAAYVDEYRKASDDINCPRPYIEYVEEVSAEDQAEAARIQKEAFLNAIKMQRGEI